MRQAELNHAARSPERDANDTYKAARSIHELCQQLMLSGLTQEQVTMIKQIDGHAFSIFTLPSIQL